MANEYSEQNLKNSVAAFLAAKLLEAGYLIYWQRIDAVETPDALYPQYSTQQATYLADPVFAARVADAQGLLTLTEARRAAEPRWVVRPTTDGQVVGQPELPIPALAVAVAPAVALGAYELGASGLKWRLRHLVIQGFARSPEEQTRLSEWLAQWFDDEANLDVRDHAAGTMAVVGNTTVRRPRVDIEEDVDGAEATTYEVLLNAGLEYVA